MGARVRAVVVVTVVLAVGAFIGSTASQFWTPREDVISRRGPGTGAAEGAAPPGERVRVEVLNGGGRSGMARAATDRLRDRGFDVVYYGNAESFDHDSSMVLDRVARPDFARAVATALGVADVRTEPDSNLYLDVTVVLGAAWKPPDPPRPGSEEAVPAWWDLRRFFRGEGDWLDDSVGVPPGRMTDPGEEGGGT